VGQVRLQYVIRVGYNTVKEVVIGGVE